LQNSVHGCAGDDAMAQVEDVAGTVRGQLEDFGDAGFEDGFRGEQGDGVEIALNGAAWAGGADAFIEGDAPVEAEDVCSGFAEGGEQACGIYAEVDDGDAEGLDALDEFCGGGEAVPAVIRDGECACPGVEDLDDVGAGFYLLGGVGDEDFD